MGGMSGAPPADTSQVYKQALNRSTSFYRLTSAQFDALENAWDDPTLQVSDDGTNDSRMYKSYLDTHATSIDSSDPALYAGVDYPSC